MMHLAGGIFFYNADGSVAERFGISVIKRLIAPTMESANALFHYFFSVFSGWFVVANRSVELFQRERYFSRVFHITVLLVNSETP